MNQDQQPRPWWSEHRSLLVLVALAVVLAVFVGLGYGFRWAWTGLETKSAWDWLELLIIPVVLGAGALWFNTKQARRGEQQQRQNELEIANEQRQNELMLADQQRQEDSLQSYLDRMQELILDKGLRKSEKNAEIRDVARVRTLVVLRSLDGYRKTILDGYRKTILDGYRKTIVVKFLYEAGLIGKVAREESGERQGIEAIIDLGDANLSGAHLRDAFLRGVILTGAWVTNEQLAEVRSLVGATLPDGRKMTAEGWEEFKTRYRVGS
jgi:hypothetical protein